MVIHNICQWFINLDYTRPIDHDRSIKVSQEIIYTARLSEVPIDFRSWASRSLGSPCGDAAAMASSGRAGAHSSWAGCSKHWAAKSMSWTGHGDKQKLNVHNGFGLHHCCILFVIRRQTQENTSRLLVVVPEKCGSTLHAWIARQRLRLRWQHGALLEVPGAYKCTQQLSWLLQTFGSYPTLIGVIPVISYYIPLSLAYHHYPRIIREIFLQSSTLYIYLPHYSVVFHHFRPNFSASTLPEGWRSDSPTNPDLWHAADLAIWQMKSWIYIDIGVRKWPGIGSIYSGQDIPHDCWWFSQYVNICIYMYI